MITTNMGALSTVVNKKCNYLIDGSPKSEAYQTQFVEALGELMEDPEKLRIWSAMNKQTMFEAKCDWTDIGRRWVDIMYLLLRED
jgi:hypothetical protein